MSIGTHTLQKIKLGISLRPEMGKQKIQVHAKEVYWGHQKRSDRRISVFFTPAMIIFRKTFNSETPSKVVPFLVSTPV